LNPWRARANVRRAKPRASLRLSSVLRLACGSRVGPDLSVARGPQSPEFFELALRKSAGSEKMPRPLDRGPAPTPHGSRRHVRGLPHPVCPPAYDRPAWMPDEQAADAEPPPVNPPGRPLPAVRPRSRCVFNSLHGICSDPGAESSFEEPAFPDPARSRSRTV
jgi:hypothetical protein